MSWNRAGKIFFVVSFLAFATVVLYFPEPPLLQDYPDWVYQGVLLAKTLTGHPVAGYALKLYPVPNSLTTVGLGLLTVLFGWQLAAKLWVLIYLIFGAATGFYVASVLSVKNAGLWWGLAATLFLGRLFWIGTINFNFGLCFLLLVACRLYRRQDGALALGTLLLACFFVHLVIYAAAMLMVLLYCMQYHRWKLVYVGLAMFPLVFWYFAGRLFTHSMESEYGNTRASHLVLPIVVTLVLLAMGLVKRRSIHRMAGTTLVTLSAVIVGLALASCLLPSQHFSAGVQSDIFLLQLKALQPFMLFGFINLVSTLSDGQGVSATLKLFHEPFYMTLMAFTVLASAMVLLDAARALMARRRDVDETVEPEGEADFLWDFLAVFGLIYVFSPPNALGVSMIDLRFAQIALAIALFLLARKASSTLRVAGLTSALLLVSSVYQFGVSQHRVELPGRRMIFSPVLDYGAGIDARARVAAYDALRSGRLNYSIFTTGMYSTTATLP